MTHFRHDPYEMHHRGLVLQPAHHRLLDHPPQYVMVPYRIPDPIIWVYEGAREGLGRLPTAHQLVVPVSMELIDEQQLKEIEEEYEEHYGENWNQFATLYGWCFDPVNAYFGIDDYMTDELPWQPIRLHACWPLEEGQANALDGWVADAFADGPWPKIELYTRFCEEYGEVESALGMATREIPEGLPDDKRKRLEQEAEEHFVVAANFEALERELYPAGADSECVYGYDDFDIELPPGDLADAWMQLRLARQRAMSSLPRLLSGSELSTERLYYSWP